METEPGHLGKNKWALYNTMTEWATHTDESRSPAVTRRLRENQVAKAVPLMQSIQENNMDIAFIRQVSETKFQIDKLVERAKKAR